MTTAANALDRQNAIESAASELNDAIRDALEDGVETKITVFDIMNQHGISEFVEVKVTVKPSRISLGEI